ncbi:hypothetical protein BV372_05500 [Nostoc sp. T09]|uniref:glycosyltransferase family 2 protein n=1 Tax=Nostoc sp. T09 TaxID=1932621 RepID=UPI000A3C98CC|nr:glycosyltransferase family 2 protein [Nostoc sp. T09]OUL36823.1 hypothetical protein BV372_05500 [Nostoc sp. T09]
MHHLCVVISYWVGSSPKFLYKLIDQIVNIKDELSFPIVLVCNGGTDIFFSLPRKFKKYNIEIVNRPNSGFNIAAWEEGWRSIEAKNYLFIQDDCFILDDNWYSGFIDRFHSDPTLGLLGERTNPNWDKAWSELKQSYFNQVVHYYDVASGFDLFPNVDNYLDYLKTHNIPCGEKADHLQSLVLFTTRDVLLEIDGFPLPDNDTKGRAVAAEIAISKKIQSRGYRIDIVGKHPFTYIGHREWTDSKFYQASIIKLLQNKIRKVILFKKQQEREIKYILLSEAEAMQIAKSSPEK